MKTAQDNISGSSPSTVSVVVPLFNERAALDELYARLSAVLGDVAATYSNRLMRLRVLAQFIAIIIIMATH